MDVDATTSEFDAGGESQAQTPADDVMPDGFPSPEELTGVDSHLDDVETVLKNLDVDKGLEEQCRDLDGSGTLSDRPALGAYWRARTAAANRQ